MSKILISSLILLISICSFFTPELARAQGTNCAITTNPTAMTKTSDAISINIRSGSLPSNKVYQLSIDYRPPESTIYYRAYTKNLTESQSSTIGTTGITVDLNKTDIRNAWAPGVYTIEFYTTKSIPLLSGLFGNDPDQLQCNKVIKVEELSDKTTTCTLELTNKDQSYTPDTPIDVTANKLPAGTYDFILKKNGSSVYAENDVSVSQNNAKSVNLKTQPPGNYTVEVRNSCGKTGIVTGCTNFLQCPVLRVAIGTREKPADQSKINDPTISPNSCINGEDVTGKACSSSAGQFCNPDDGKPVQKGSSNAKGVMTAIGCVPTEPEKFIGAILRLGTLAGGGVALLLMIAGSFTMMTAQGNADNIKKGREQFTSAAIGLVFIIFSVALLQIIGVDILAIPGFR